MKVCSLASYVSDQHLLLRLTRDRDITGHGHVTLPHCESTKYHFAKLFQLQKETGERYATSKDPRIVTSFENVTYDQLFQRQGYRFLPDEHEDRVGRSWFSLLANSDAQLYPPTTNA